MGDIIKDVNKNALSAGLKILSALNWLRFNWNLHFYNQLGSLVWAPYYRLGPATTGIYTRQWSSDDPMATTNLSNSSQRSATSKATKLGSCKPQICCCHPISNYSVYSPFSLIHLPIHFPTPCWNTTLWSHYYIFVFLYSILLSSLLLKILFIYLFIHLFLAALGLCFCMQAFSSCGEWGLRFVAVHGLLLIAVASLVAEYGL